MAELITFLVTISLLFLLDLKGWLKRIFGDKISSTEFLLWLPYVVFAIFPYVCIVVAVSVAVRFDNYISISILPNEIKSHVRSIYGSDIFCAVGSIIFGIFFWSVLAHFKRRIVKFDGQLSNATFERISGRQIEIHIDISCAKVADATAGTLLNGLKEHLTNNRIEKLKSAKIAELIVASLWLNSPKIISKVLDKIKKLHPALSTLQITNYKMGWLPSISLRIYQLIETLKICTESKILNSKFRINKYFLNIFLKILKLLKPSKCKINMWRTFDKIDKGTKSDFFSRPLMSGFIILIT